MQPADEILVDAPAEAEPDQGSGLERVFRDHHGRVVNLLARLTGDRAHAEDIASDVFCKLARRPAFLRRYTDLTAWIYRVATNAGFDALRSGARRRRRELEAGVESIRVSAQPCALDELLREERRARVRETLSHMKSRDAKILLLRSNGLAYREIADAVGVSPGSVGTLLARAEAEFERRFIARGGGERSACSEGGVR